MRRVMGSHVVLSDQERQCLDTIRTILSEHGAIPAFQSGMNKYLNAAKAGSAGRLQCYLGKLSDMKAMNTEDLRKHVEAKLAKRGWLKQGERTMSEEELPGYNHAFYADQLDIQPEDNRPIEFGKYSIEDIMKGLPIKDLLPAQLILAEDGQWETPSWARTSDDDVWVSQGWKAWTYEGHVFFFDKEKPAVQQWLADNGYSDTGDGAHYQQGEEINQ